MKKLVSIGTVCMVVVFLSSTAFAQDFSASVGLKTWYNKWEGVFEVADLDSDDSGWLVGPSLKCSYGKLFGGATYLRSMSDYGMDTSGVGWREKGEADREDIDILVGFMIHPRCGLMAGYKRIVSEGTVDHVETGGYSESYDVIMDITGFALGATFNYPLSELPDLPELSAMSDLPVVLTCSMSYMPNMKYDIFSRWEWQGDEGTEWDSASETYHKDGYSFEIGATYAFREDIGFSLGYKYQQIDKGDYGKKRGYGDMEFSGITLSADYRF